MLTVSLLAALGAGCDGEVDTDLEALCSPYDDQAQEAEVVVRVHNQGTEPIFLGGSGCGSWIDLALADAQGSYLSWRQDACTFTCQDLRDDDIGACALSCAMPPTYMVAPGGVYETSWSGTYLSTESMPDDCYAGSQHADSCQQQIVAPPASYALTVSAWDQVQCDVDPCTCTPDVNGVCQLEYAWSDGPQRQATVTVAYPDELSVDITFD